MPIFLGIDLGSTSITVSALDAREDGCDPVGSFSLPNDAETTSLSDRLIGRSEWDIERMTTRAGAAVRVLIEAHGIEKVEGIGITGQQQGCQLLDKYGKPIAPFIAWQDQRAKEAMPRTNGNYLDAMGETGGAFRRGEGLPTFPNAGCPIVTGYTAPTLFWLNANEELHPDTIAAITAPEYLVHRLVGSTRPITDATDAAGWGIFDVPDRGWNTDLCKELGIDPSLLPELRDSCTIAGSLCDDAAAMLNLSSGIPVAVASGDHQCSFVAAAGSHSDVVVVNIGTGGQASVFVRDLSHFRIDEQSSAIDHGWLELRPHIQNGYLLAGVGIVGGRTFRTLKDFFVRTAMQLFDKVDTQDDEIYSRLVDLARTARDDEEPPNSVDSISSKALFTGSRENPCQRGSFWGITPGNFAPGALTLALFRSMASELTDSYSSAMGLGAGSRSRLAGSGSGLRKNDVLKGCIEDAFGMEISFGRCQEEAAGGAALCAAVAMGIYKDIDVAAGAAV